MNCDLHNLKIKGIIQFDAILIDVNCKPIKATIICGDDTR